MRRPVELDELITKEEAHLRDMLLEVKQGLSPTYQRRKVPIFVGPNSQFVGPNFHKGIRNASNRKYRNPAQIYMFDASRDEIKQKSRSSR